MNLDITQFSPEDLQALAAALQSIGGAGLDAQGRSPLKPRQLRDLRLLPSATDPRPTFFMSADPPRDVDITKTTPYPRLMWHGTSGEEITVPHAKAQADKLASGYVLAPPANAPAPKVFDVVAAQLDGLSDKDKAALLKSYQQDRLAKLQALIAELPEHEIAALLERKEGVA